MDLGTNTRDIKGRYDPDLRQKAQESFDAGIWAALDLCRQARQTNEDYNPFQAFERRIILLALRQTRGNQLQAARMLGISRSTLRKRIKRHEITIGMKVVDAPSSAPLSRAISNPETEQSQDEDS